MEKRGGKYGTDNKEEWRGADTAQFNFFDHTKLILSQDGEVVSFIDKNYELHTWSLEMLLAKWKAGSPDRAERKRVEGVVYKLQYGV